MDIDDIDAKVEKLVIKHKAESIIPNNKLAKLMYYLHCVSTVIELDIKERYKSYIQYSIISILEEQTILKLVSTYNIQLMKELNLFRIQPDFVPLDKENEFFEISDERFAGNINTEVVIENEPRKVLKIMVCNQSWIDKYYEEPLKEYEKPL